MNLKKLSPLPFIIALLCLLLPFVSRVHLFKYSGFDLIKNYFDDAGGGIDYLAELGIPGELISSGGSIPPNIYIIIFTGLLVVALLFSLSQNKSSSIAASVLGGAGILSLILFVVSIQGSKGLLEEFVGMIGVETIKFEYGFYLTALFSLAAVIMSVPALSEKEFNKSGEPHEGRPLRPKGAPSVRRGPVIPANKPVNRQHIPVNNQAPQEVNQPFKPQQSPMPSMPPSELPRKKEIQQKVTDPKEPVLIGIKGQYAGQKVSLKDGQVSIGRDPRLSNLVYSQSNEEISRKHCTVSYDNASKSFYIKDSSTNGTFLSPKERLPNGEDISVKAGNKFYLSNTKELFELNLE